MSADTGSPRVDTSRSSREGAEADGGGSHDVVAGASGKRDVGRGIDEKVRYRCRSQRLDQLARAASNESTKMRRGGSFRRGNAGQRLALRGPEAAAQLARRERLAGRGNRQRRGGDGGED